MTKIDIACLLVCACLRRGQDGQIELPHPRRDWSCSPFVWRSERQCRPLPPIWRSGIPPISAKNAEVDGILCFYL